MCEVKCVLGMLELHFFVGWLHASEGPTKVNLPPAVQQDVMALNLNMSQGLYHNTSGCHS